MFEYLPRDISPIPPTHENEDEDDDPATLSTFRKKENPEVRVAEAVSQPEEFTLKEGFIKVPLQLPADDETRASATGFLRVVWKGWYEFAWGELQGRWKKWSDETTLAQVTFVGLVLLVQATFFSFFGMTLFDGEYLFKIFAPISKQVPVIWNAASAQCIAALHYAHSTVFFVIDFCIKVFKMLLNLFQIYMESRQLGYVPLFRPIPSLRDLFLVTAPTWMGGKRSSVWTDAMMTTFYWHNLYVKVPFGFITTNGLIGYAWTLGWLYFFLSFPIIAALYELKVYGRVVCALIALRLVKAMLYT
ncbi:hypothetical protein BT69DRAFT_1353461 [Atractiella rhizophila]|nr:hypothetical protein BT69DRAFT_1353461 [Atractiella rhizophila]